MKLLLTWAVCILLGLNCYSQQLEGKWRGLYSYFHQDSRWDNINNYPITFDITLNSDSSYTVYTNFKGFDNDDISANITCGAILKVMNTDSICIQEILIVKPAGISKDNLKKMYLKIKNKKSLDGIFEGYHDGDKYRGKITLQKVS